MNNNLLFSNKNKESPSNIINQTDLQKIVKEWLTIDDEISRFNQVLRDKKNRKKELTEYIMTFMKSNEIPFFNTSDSKLILAESKQKKPLSKENLFNLTNNYFNNQPAQAANLVNYINNNRETFVRNRLKRSKLKDN